MKQAIVHIGLHKTGSSALQHFLNANRTLLGQLGYYLPDAGWTGLAHHQICYDILKFARFDPEQACLAHLNLEVSQHKQKGLSPILTSEEFERFGAKDVDVFRDALGLDDCQIVIFLRRQDDYLISDYGQQIKMGAKQPPFSEYLRSALKDPRFDYRRALDAWAGVFGINRVKAVVYSEATKSKGTQSVFLETCQLPGLTDEAWTVPNRDMNVSWTTQETEFVRRTTQFLRRNYNVSGFDWTQVYRYLYPTIQTYCSEISTRLQVTQEESNFVRQHFLESSKAVVERFNVIGDHSDLLFKPRAFAEPSRYTVAHPWVVEFANMIASQNDLKRKPKER